MNSHTHTVPITAIIENNGEFLFIKRSKHERNMAGKWVFPGGKVEKGEDAIQALFRELTEETSLSFDNEVAFLSSYQFTRNEDSSSSLGLVFLVRAQNRAVKIDNSIETYKWIAPEDIADYKFTYEEITDFEKDDKVTIPGMEVHVRNAIIALRDNNFMHKNLLSVTEYQKQNCSMDKTYLLNLKKSNNVNMFPHK